MNDQAPVSEYRHAALVREIIDGFPPLTAEQKARIAVLLRGSAQQPAKASNAA
ncbi:hypothetical protein [Microbispora siamensis]|nr:hypothetical protein [Microbispora siamensis]